MAWFKVALMLGFILLSFSKVIAVKLSEQHGKDYDFFSVCMLVEMLKLSIAAIQLGIQQFAVTPGHALPGNAASLHAVRWVL